MATLSHAKREWLPAYFIAIHVITTTLVCVRLISRFQWRGGRLGLDDLFIFISWCIGTASVGLSIEAALHLGFDGHIWDLPLGVSVEAQEVGQILSMLYLWSTAVTKISILMFYRRLVRGSVSRRYIWSLWICMAVVVLYTLIIFFLWVTICVPLHDEWLEYDPVWHREHPHLKCSSPRQVLITSYAAGIMSVATDFATVALPAWIFMNIKITRRQRIGMMSIFGLGFLVSIAGLVRTIYLVKAEGLQIDKTWNAFSAIVAAQTEGDFGIVCACAPSLKSFFRHFFRDRTSTDNTKSRSPGTTGNTGNTGSSTNRSEGTQYSLAPQELHPWRDPEEKDLDQLEESTVQNIPQSGKRPKHIPIIIDTGTEVAVPGSRNSSHSILANPTTVLHTRSHSPPDMTEINQGPVTLPSMFRPATAFDDDSLAETEDDTRNSVQLSQPEPAHIHPGAERWLNDTRGHVITSHSWLSIESSSSESSDDEAELTWRIKAIQER